ncbi:hypothetical protein WDU94_003831 [Cyamophila willieti]
MKTKVSSNQKPKSSIPHCPYEIPISTIYNPSSNDSDIPVVSIYNPNLNQNTRPPETKPNLQTLWMEKLKAQFHKDQRKKLEFYMAVCFLITLVATGAIIVIMHKSKFPFKYKSKYLNTFPSLKCPFELLQSSNDKQQSYNEINFPQTKNKYGYPGRE